MKRKKFFFKEHVVAITFLTFNSFTFSAVKLHVYIWNKSDIFTYTVKSFLNWSKHVLTINKPKIQYFDVEYRLCFTREAGFEIDSFTCVSRKKSCLTREISKVYIQPKIKPFSEILCFWGLLRGYTNVRFFDRPTHTLWNSGDKL